MTQALTGPSRINRRGFSFSPWTLGFFVLLALMTINLIHIHIVVTGANVASALS